MEYVIVSNVAEKTPLFIEDDMTVGEVRAIIRVMLDAPDDVEMTMTLNGRKLCIDEDVWGTIAPRVATSSNGVRKLYCNVASRPKLESGSAEALRAVIPGKEQTLEEERAERARARAMEPMIDALSRNPEVMKSMMASQPGLKKLMESNPEVARQMMDPDTLKMMMMSQLDPDRRKEMNRNMELALSRISDYPGGQQMFERYMSSFLRDEENLTQRTEADLHATSEDLAMPDPSRERNSDALPNPWQQRQPQAVPSTNGPGGLQGLHQLMGGGGMAGAAGGSAGGNPFATDPIALQRMMAMLMPQPQGGPPASADGSPAPPAAAVSVDYSAEVEVLRSMGFEDEALCREALSKCHGDVEAAVEYIDEKQNA